MLLTFFISPRNFYTYCTATKSRYFQRDVKHNRFSIILVSFGPIVHLFAFFFPCDPRCAAARWLRLRFWCAEVTRLIYSKLGRALAQTVVAESPRERSLALCPCTSVASSSLKEQRDWSNERAVGKRRSWYSNSQHACSTRGYIETRANAF